MQINLEAVSKRYIQHWIFQDVNYNIAHGDRIAIVGSNGSGKSTLIQILSGSLSPSKGKIHFSDKSGSNIPIDQVFKQVSISTPYMNTIEEFTLPELFEFQSKFKPFQSGMKADDFVEVSGLASHRHKLINQFSSGMKQRVKLILALLSDTSLVLLDEPTTNLDTKSTDWYLRLVEDYAADRTVVVASNLEREYAFTTKQLDIEAFKNVPAI